MTFTEILSNFTTLRTRLTTIDKNFTIKEILIPVPKNNNDELSFLRLVAWGYVLLNENAKIHLKFLMEFGVEKNQLPQIHFLRTYMAHNMSFDKSNDLSTMRNAQGWFRKVCANVSPDSQEEWKKCFESLANDLNALIKQAIKNCEFLEDNTDGPANKEELNKRIEKDWEAYRFDCYVQKAIDNLGYQIDIVSFRKIHLDTWKSVVKTADKTQIDKLLLKRIEADLIQHMNSALPFTIDELSKILNFNTKTEIQAFALFLRDKVKDGVRLKEMIEEIASAQC